MMRTSPLNSHRSATHSSNILHLLTERKTRCLSTQLFDGSAWICLLRFLQSIITAGNRGRDDRLSMFINPCEVQRKTQNKSLQPLQESTGHLLTAQLWIAWLAFKNPTEGYNIQGQYRKRLNFHLLMINIVPLEAFLMDSGHLHAKQYLRYQQVAKALVNQLTNPSSKRMVLESSQGQDIPCYNDYCTRQRFLQYVSGRFEAKSCWELWTTTEFNSKSLVNG